MVRDTVILTGDPNYEAPDPNKNEVLIWSGDSDQGLHGECIYFRDYAAYKVSITNPETGEVLTEWVRLDTPLKEDCEVDPENEDFLETLQVCMKLGAQIRRQN